MKALLTDKLSCFLILLTIIIAFFYIISTPEKDYYRSIILITILILIIVVAIRISNKRHKESNELIIRKSDETLHNMFDYVEKTLGKKRV